MDNFQLEELIKNIQAMIKCPSCGNAYKKENIRFLGQMGQAVLVQLNCYSCKMPVMATIVVSGSGKLPNFKDIEALSSRGFQENIIEAKDNDIVNQPVSSDEILDMHEFLDNFDGNFRDLFSK